VIVEAASGIWRNPPCRQERPARRRARPAILFIVLVAVAGCGAAEQDTDRVEATSPEIAHASADTPATAVDAPGFLYGRVTTDDGATHEGRLRWAGDEEASWGDYFNGAKGENPWIAELPPEKQEHPLEIFGFRFDPSGRSIDPDRPFMARFGDIARLESQGYYGVRVILKSGTAVDIDRMDANDFDDGVRVWDAGRGVVDIEPQHIVTIVFLPTAPLVAAPERLHGTVRTRQGDFTGFVQWDRNEGVGSDTLDGRTADGDVSLRFDTIRSIARDSSTSSLVTLVDGRQVVLSGTRDAGDGNLGLYVDDERYGRVLVSWDAFERVDFGPGGSGPAYGDFPEGHPLTGTVTTRDGRRLTGRLVYDLDESETTDTLDAPSEGVDYTLPFGLVASISLPGRAERDGGLARVTLHNGETLVLELSGDLGERNAGLLVFVDGRQSPEYVSWADVEQIELDRPPAMYPPIGGR